MVSVQTAMAPIAVAAMCGQLAVVRHFINLNDLDLSLPAVSWNTSCTYDPYNVSRLGLTIIRYPCIYCMCIDGTAVHGSCYSQPV